MMWSFLVLFCLSVNIGRTSRSRLIRSSNVEDESLIDEYLNGLQAEIERAQQYTADLRSRKRLSSRYAASDRDYGDYEYFDDYYDGYDYGDYGYGDNEYYEYGDNDEYHEYDEYGDGDEYYEELTGKKGIVIFNFQLSDLIATIQSLKVITNDFLRTRVH